MNVYVIFNLNKSIHYLKFNIPWYIFKLIIDKSNLDKLLVEWHVPLN